MRLHLGYLFGMVCTSVLSFHLGARYGSARALWARAKRRLSPRRADFE